MNILLKTAAAIVAVALIALLGFVADANIRIATEENLSPDTGATGRFVNFDGYKLHVATVGDVTADPSGAPLLLVHGDGVQGHAAWLPWASKLAPHRSLILPDLLGFGHSDRILAPDVHYTLKSRAASLAAVLDTLGVTQVDVIGQSLGGAVAAQFALDYPARVRRIVFMDAAIYSHPDRRPHTGAKLLDRALVWQSLGGGPWGGIAQACKHQPNCRLMRMARVRGTTDAMLAMASVSQGPENLTAIGAPSLVIWGSDDRLTPVADGDRLARDLKTTIAIVADAGHAPYVAQPDKVARRVLDFFAPQAAR